MTTPHLNLPFLMPAQAQSYLTLNQALERLDAGVQMSILGTYAAPSEELEIGDCVFVDTDPTGAFTGHTGEIACRGAGGWEFLMPREGWLAWDITDAQVIVFNGGSWAPLSSAAPESFTRLGINKPADPTHQLSVKGDSTLLAADADSHRLILNRVAETDTASLILQTGYQGQAELGLTGSSGLALRVSVDGQSWADALTVDTASGEVSIPNLTDTDAPTGRVRRVSLAPGAGRYIVPEGVRSLSISVQGAGGGGAGAKSASNTRVGAGGGGGGGYAEILITSEDFEDGYDYVVGTGGTGGSAGDDAPTGARNGGAGGSSSFAGGDVDLLGEGGAGALERTAVSGNNEFLGGAGGDATGGDINLPGQNGNGGITSTTYSMIGNGRGGCSHMGQGGAFSNGTGKPGLKYGGGGAGAGMIPGLALNRAGGAGADGGIWITESY